MAASRLLAVEPELSGLTALARLLQIVGERRAPERELTRYTELVERIGIAAADVALLGLFDACDQFATALRSLMAADNLPPEALAALQDWVPLVRAYTLSPGDEAASQALVSHLRKPFWRISMSEADAANLLDALHTAPTHEQLAAPIGESVGARDDFCNDFGLDAEPESPADAEPAGPLSDDDVLTQLELTSSMIMLSETAVKLRALMEEQESRAADITTAHLVFDDAPEDLNDALALDDAPTLDTEATLVGKASFEIAPALSEASLFDGAQSLSNTLDFSESQVFYEVRALDSGPDPDDLPLANDPVSPVAEPESSAMPFDSAASLLDGWNDEPEKSAEEAPPEFVEIEEAFETTITETSSDPATITQSISPAIQDVLTVLIDELPQVSVSFDALVGLASASHIELDVFANAVEHTAEMLSRLGSTTESLGLAGLSFACEHLRSNLKSADHETKTSIARAGDLWGGVVPAIREYLRSPYDSARAKTLTSLLTDPRFASPMSLLDATALARELASPQLLGLEMEGPARAQTASAEDVSLALPEDVNPELVDALLHELPQQTEDLSAAVQRLLSAGSLEDVVAAQRIAHTIKGAGNTVGVRGIAELTHQLEDILLALAKHEVLPTPSLAQTLVAASDCLQDMAEALQGAGPAPGDSINVLQEVLDWANRIEREGPPTDYDAPTEITAQADAPQQAQASAQPARPLSPPPVVESRASVAARSESVVPAPEAASKPEDREAIVPMLRVPSALIDDLLRLVAEAMIQNSQLHERVRSTRQDARAMIRQFDLLQQIGTELEEIIDLRDLSSSQHNPVADTKFDALELDQYNELHTHSRRLIEAAVDAREIGRNVIDNLGDLNDMLVTQERLNRDTQDGVLRARMIPVKSVFPRLERSVRQTCRMTGKQVELHLSGGETQMDSDVLGRIVDPLMHVLRNAVDHGIENAERREAVGKDPTGHITLEFLRDGKSILVRCRDDGSGLDFDAIREAAEARGLVVPKGEATEEVLKRFVLLPNFTTRRSVTQTSGRGIGLDAVHTSVAELGGSLTLSSTKGNGCVIEIRLPVSLLSSNALLVRAGGQVVAITSRGIEQIRHIQDGEIRRFGNELVFQTGEQMIQTSLLDSVLNLSAPTPESLEDHRAVLIVRSERGEHAILVKSVMASRDVVVKTLGHYIPKMRGIVGATILGDGSVTPVIDLAELLRTAATAGMDGTATLSATSSRHSRARRALVVDDSLSARKSMAQVLTDAGFEVSTARDGMEAVDVLEKSKPDILFVDLEMPRMNGIELTSHVRSRAETSHLPIVMITSRSTEKHRSQAKSAGVNAYLTKPFDADTLLEQAERLMAGP